MSSDDEDAQTPREEDGDAKEAGADDTDDEEDASPKKPLTKAELKKQKAAAKKAVAAEKKAKKSAAAAERKAAAAEKKKRTADAKANAKADRLAAAVAKRKSGASPTKTKKDQADGADTDDEEQENEGSDDAGGDGDGDGDGDVEMMNRSSKWTKEKKRDAKASAQDKAKAKAKRKRAKEKAKKRAAKRAAKEEREAERRARRGAAVEEGGDEVSTMLRDNRDRKRRRRQLEQMPDLQPHPHSFEKVRPRMRTSCAGRRAPPTACRSPHSLRRLAHLAAPPPPRPPRRRAARCAAWPQLIALFSNLLVLVASLVASQVMCLFLGVCLQSDDPAITPKTSAAIVPTLLATALVATLGVAGTYFDIPLLVAVHAVASVISAAWCVFAAIWAMASTPVAWNAVEYTQQRWYSGGEEGFLLIAARNHLVAAAFAFLVCLLLVLSTVTSVVQFFAGRNTRDGESAIYRHWLKRRRRKGRAL